MREGKTPLRGRARRRARARRADHRDDDHARRGLRADRLPGRPHRRALPRVRVHARGRGLHLRRRRAHAVADDVVAAPAAPSTSTGCFARAIDRAFEALKRALRARARRRRCATRPARLRGLDRALAAASCRCTCSRRRSSRRTRTRASSSAPIDVPANATLEQLTPYTAQVVDDVRRPTPEFESQLPDHASRPAASAACSSSRGTSASAPSSRSRTSCARKLARHHRASARRRSCRRRCPSAGHLPGRVRDRLDRRATTSSSASRSSSSHEAMKSGQFAFPPIIDVQIDQAEDRDRHRPRQGRVDGPQHAAGRRRPRRRCSAATSSTASTSTGAATRSSRRSSAPARLTPDQLERHPRHRARTASSSRSARSRRSTNGVEPRTLNRFQQLNAVKISGVAPRGARRRRCKVLEDAAARDPAAGLRASTTPASRASCARRAASSCRRWASRSC